PLARRLGRVIAGILPSRLVRMPAVLLDALAQGRLAAALVPAADVWHARGLLAVPTALALRDRHGGRVVYDAGHLYVDARHLARGQGGRAGCGDRAHGPRRPPGRPRGARRGRAERAASPAPARPAGPGPAVGRERRRGGDAHPTDDPEPSAHDAEQAVRGD